MKRMQSLSIVKEENENCNASEDAIFICLGLRFLL